MSRVGKKLIPLPSGVSIDISSSKVVVKGPKGELSLGVDTNISILLEENFICVQNKSEDVQFSAKHGLYRALLNNMVIGVSQGFVRGLNIVGVGYKVQLQGKDLVFSLGYSHPVQVAPPEGILFEVEGTTKIRVRGIDIGLVGLVASEIRAIRKPDPYKGKGVLYDGEVIKKKQGKSVKK